MNKFLWSAKIREWEAEVVSELTEQRRIDAKHQQQYDDLVRWVEERLDEIHRLVAAQPELWPRNLAQGMVDTTDYAREVVLVEITTLRQRIEDAKFVPIPQNWFLGNYDVMMTQSQSEQYYYRMLELMQLHTIPSACMLSCELNIGMPQTMEMGQFAGLLLFSRREDAFHAGAVAIFDPMIKHSYYVHRLCPILPRKFLHDCASAASTRRTAARQQPVKFSVIGVNCRCGQIWSGRCRMTSTVPKNIIKSTTSLKMRDTAFGDSKCRTINRLRSSTFGASRAYSSSSTG